MFVQRFLDWSVAASVDQRSSAIKQLADLFVSGSIAADDYKSTERVLTLFLQDPSTKVRCAMASSLAVSNDVPRALIWSLMQDVSQVACEIYAVSTLIRPADLIHAARHGDELIQTAIAKRADMSADCVRTLVEAGQKTAVLALLKNDSIKLSPDLLHDLAQRFGEFGDIRDCLLSEETLLPTTRQLLVMKLSETLLGLVGENAWAPQERVAVAANDARNAVTHDIAMNAEAEQIDAYVRHLRETGQLTPALLVRTICLGNKALFESAIAKLSGASLNRVRSIVSEGRIRSFKALYSKTGLPEAAYGVFAAAISAWQHNDNSADVVDSIIDAVQDDQSVDCSLIAMLSRMESELHRSSFTAVAVPQLAKAA